MNLKMLRYIIGQLLIAEGALMALPLVTMLIYGEFNMLYTILIPMAALFTLGFGLSIRKPENKTLRAKDGFVVVGLSWIVLSIFGCLPFVLSGLIPNFIDAYFETVSGFTTTGASVLSSADFDLLWLGEGMRGIFLWRSFTNWIGGMGVLVFVLAIMPQQDMKSSRLVHIMRAEMPGPKVDKLVATVKKTAAIMYTIYISLTILQATLLLFGGMNVYEAFCTAFSTAGTGGFAIWGDSMMSFGGTVAHLDFCVWVVAAFMFIFSINFNLFYLIITGKALVALCSEELRWFVGFVLIFTTAIAMNIYHIYGNLGDTVRNAFFQVSNIMSTSGFATADFNTWPHMSKTVILILMFIGACAGSTGGGIKVSRFLIAGKTVQKEMGSYIHPKSIKKIQMDSKPIEHEVVRSTNVYFMTYLMLFALFLFLISLEGQDLVTSFTAVAATFNNIGPGLELVGPMGNFSVFSGGAKLVLIFNMLAGRLELFPLLLLFSRETWRKF